MDNNMTNSEIKELVKQGKLGIGDLTDLGICPTCFNRENDFVVFGDDRAKTIYEDDYVKCILVGNPRSEGHVAIISNEHFKDMMEIPDELCVKTFLLAKKVMNVLKEVYEAESVYLCTMCDGPMNHFHVQLIPRYSFEKRGSKNFVKPRFQYTEDKDKIRALRERLNEEH